MKKAISIILAALMLVSVLSVTAMASNGPNPDKNEFEETASIYFFNVVSDGGDIAIFDENVVYNDAVEGAVYDLETNTLTLTDFNYLNESNPESNQPKYSLSLEDMGDDFKLNIVGECVLAGISSSTGSYGGSITITGSGKLTVNPNKQDETAVSLSASGADSTLHIDNTVSVAFYSCWEAVTFYGTAHADKDTVFTQGEDTVEVEGGKPSYELPLTVNGAYVVDYEGNRVGYRAHQANDPDYVNGMYSVTIEEKESGKVYHVEKYVIEDNFGSWTKDESFEPLDLSEDDFNAQFEIDMTGSDTPKEIEYTDGAGETKTGFLMQKEGDVGVEYFVIDIDFNKEPSDEMHHARPVLKNDDGSYSLVETWLGYEVTASNYYNVFGLEYVYDDVYVDFRVPEIAVDEFIVYEDAEGRRYVIDEDYNVYSISEDKKVTIDGKECYVMTLMQGIAIENLEIVTHVEEDDFYTYEYPEEDYIYTAPQLPTGETETAEATADETQEPTEEIADATEEPTEEPTGGEIVPPTTEGQTETAEATETQTESQAVQTDPIVPPETGNPETAAPTEEPTIVPTNAPIEAPTLAPTTEAPKTTEATVKEIKPGTPEKQVDKYVSSLKTEKDAKGTTFGLLCARQKKATKKSVTVKWNKLKKAKSYIVYGAKCGTKKGQIPPYKKIKTVKGTSYTKKGLKKGVYFKFIIVALDKNKKVIASSKTVHIATKGGKVGNDKTVKVNKTKVTLKVKKTFKIKGKEIAQSKKLKVKRHRKLRFESSDKKIAKVNGKGKVTAKKKGTAYIYVYAQNGLYKKVKITVK